MTKTKNTFGLSTWWRAMSASVLTILLTTSVEAQVSCIGEVNATIGTGCARDIAPDEILTPASVAGANAVVQIERNGVWQTGANAARITTADIGRRFRVRVTVPIGAPNSTCWGWVNVEDKDNPNITCPEDIILPCLVNPNDLTRTGTIINNGTDAPDGNLYTRNNGAYTDCSTATVTYRDAVVEHACTAPFAPGAAGLTAAEQATLRLDLNNAADLARYDALVTPAVGANAVIKIIARTFRVTDRYGNFSECTQYIALKRLDETMTILPPIEATLSCSANITDFSPEAISARANHHSWSAFPILFVPKDGTTQLVCPTPATGTTLLPSDMDLLLAGYDTFHLRPNTNLCGISVTYTDNDLNLCAGSFKKIRRWRLMNWCQAAVHICPTAVVNSSIIDLGEQVIKYLDLTPPTVTVNYTTYDITNSTLCTRDQDSAVVNLTKRDITARNVTGRFTDYNVEAGRYGVATDVTANSTFFYDLNALANSNTCTGGVTISLSVRDSSCATPGAQPRSVVPSDNRFVLASGFPRYNSSTGITEYRFNANNLEMTTDGNGDGVIDTLDAQVVSFVVTDACGYAKALQNFRIIVVDNAKPQAICIEYLQLSLGTDGRVRLNAENLNRASRDNCTNDRNLKYLVRKMNITNADGTASTPNTDPCFNEWISFGCNDAKFLENSTPNNATAATFGVVLRVCDDSGNYNDCMVQVLVEDKIRPTCVPPADMLIKCNDFSNLWNVSQYGEPTYYDNCDAELTTNAPIFNLNNCRQGTITRTWVVTDGSGNTNSGSCQQVIRVESVSDFTVDFPDDYVADCFGEIETAEEAKTKMLNNPTTADGHIKNDGCGVLAVEVSDRVADVDPNGSCYKIFRKYRVIDWCRYNPNNTNDNLSGYGMPVVGDIHSNPNWDNDFTGNLPAWENLLNRGNAQDRRFRDADVLSDPALYAPGITNTAFPTSHRDHWTYADGIICYTQVIKLIDNVAPVLVAEADALDVCDYGSGANCTAHYVKTLEATDDCQGGLGSSEGLIYNWEVARLYNPTVVLYRGNTKEIDIPSLLYDTIYVVRWHVTDRCANDAHDEYQISFKDCKKPSIVCFNVNAEVMPTSGNVGGGGQIAIWPSELVSSLSDNCTREAYLRARVRVRKAGTGSGYPINGTSVVYTCDDYNLSRTHQVEVWTIDEKDNADFCISTVTLQNNMGACGATEGRAVIAGGVQTETRANVENVTIRASMNGSQSVGTATTSSAGVFSFQALSLGQNYAVRGERSDNVLNGVTTYDIALMSRHILGTESLNSPYKIIAADVNGDREVNTADMIALRRVILHITNQFPNATPSWRFVNRAYNFINANNPLAEDFPEVVNITNAVRSNAANFTAFKVGDLNGNAAASTADEIGVRGAAGALILKTEDVQLIAGKSYSISLSAEDFNAVAMQGTFNFAKGYVDQISVTGQLPNMTEGNFGVFANAVTTSWNGKATAQTNVLTLNFRAKQNAKLSEILSVGSNLTYAEAYNPAGESMSIHLQFNSGKVTGQEFALYQNEPNPFENSTKIAFNLPETAKATLSIFDVTGKLVRIIEGNYAAGYNAVNIHKSELNVNGVLYYRLDSGNNTATKKMILLE